MSKSKADRWDFISPAPPQPSPKRAKKETKKLRPKASKSTRKAKAAAKRIRSMLRNEEGRTALAQAMVEPIRRAMDYQGIGRRILMVDELPQNIIPSYG